MTLIEDPASVTIPSTTAKDTSDNEFITGGANISLNTSNPNTTAESVHNQYQDEQKDIALHSANNDADTFESTTFHLELKFMRLINQICNF